MCIRFCEGHGQPEARNVSVVWPLKPCSCSLSSVPLLTVSSREQGSRPGRRRSRRYIPRQLPFTGTRWNRLRNQQLPESIFHVHPPQAQAMLQRNIQYTQKGRKQRNNTDWPHFPQHEDTRCAPTNSIEEDDAHPQPRRPPNNQGRYVPTRSKEKIEKNTSSGDDVDDVVQGNRNGGRSARTPSQMRLYKPKAPSCRCCSLVFID